MTNSKSTKRSLLMSAMSMLLCVSMLLGTTFAWFTDTVTSANNIIKSGNLDIELDYWDGANWKTVQNASDILTNDLWEPGVTEVAYLRIKNAGSLALKYQLGVNIVSEEPGTNVAGKTFKLSDYIYFDVIEGVDGEKTPYTRETVKNVTTQNKKISAGYTKEAEIKANDPEHYLALVVHMPTTVTNEANHNGEDIPEIALGINVFATQLVNESDTFGPEYDEEAAYGTYIELKAGEDLLDAMASAEADKPLTIKLLGDAEWPTTGHHGENDITPASSIVIDGNGKTITATGAGVTPLGDVEAPMTLKNVKIVDNSVSYNEQAWELSYLEMGGRVLKCINVDFVDPIFVDSDNANFTNCSFVGHNDKNSGENQYAVWVYNGNANFNNCSFTGTRGMKICDQYAGEVGTVVVDGCTFMDLTQKPGIAIDDRDAQDMKITIKNSTFIGCQAGDQGKYIYETDNTEPTLANNEVYGVAKEVSSASDLQSVMNSATESTKISLTGDIEAAVTIEMKKDVNFVIDGNGHTISEPITLDGKSKTYTTSGITIKNAKFEAASFDSNADACIRLGDGTNATRYVCNVTVMNCTFDVPGIVGIKSYTGGDKNVSIIGCTATESAHSLAQLKGVDGVLVENCTVKSVRGINFNNSNNITVKDSTFDVKKYAVRFGESANTTVENYAITNCTLTSDNEDGDATIVLRAGATDAKLTLTNTTVNGTIPMSGHENATIIK